ncbi:EPS15 [Symbiodinium natans]|uniref:EPS15 protein n=1 Tax=Symbiodinium natans TaxID=878477 RepID=A0A812KRS5_9DINO|nr:EPS15 [Symbiodinium natans]
MAGDGSNGLDFLQGRWAVEFTDAGGSKTLTAEVEVAGNVASYKSQSQTASDGPYKYQITCSPVGVVEIKDSSGLIWWLQKYSPWVRSPFEQKGCRSSQAIWLLDPEMNDPTPNGSLSKIVWWLRTSPIPVLKRQEALTRLSGRTVQPKARAVRKSKMRMQMERQKRKERKKRTERKERKRKKTEVEDLSTRRRPRLEAADCGWARLSRLLRTRRC